MPIVHPPWGGRGFPASVSNGGAGGASPSNVDSKDVLLCFASALISCTMDSTCTMQLVLLSRIDILASPLQNAAVHRREAAAGELES